MNQYDSLYGVPVRYALSPGQEAEAVMLDVKQTRADLRAEVDTGGTILRQIKLRAGFADYRHDELEDTGAIGTSFFNEGIEARLELVQARHGNWEGAVGGQMLVRDFNVVGEEKFLPRNRTQQYGIFTLQSFDLGPLRAEVGGRYEHSVINAFADADLGNGDIERRFDAYSGSIGASYGIAEGWRLGLSGNYSERAPSAEELYPNGPHAGTQAFEIGNPDFVKERSKGIEASLRGTGDGYNLSVSGFYNWFSDFIYDRQTGEHRRRPARLPVRSGRCALLWCGGRRLRASRHHRRLCHQCGWGGRFRACHHRQCRSGAAHSPAACARRA